MVIQLEHIESDLKVLNAIEMAMLNYAKQNPGTILNPFQWFADALGYKSKNYCYRWFKERDAAKIGYKDIKKIIEITEDISIADIVCKELKGNITEIKER